MISLCSNLVGCRGRELYGVTVILPFLVRSVPIGVDGGGRRPSPGLLLWVIPEDCIISLALLNIYIKLLGEAICWHRVRYYQYTNNTHLAKDVIKVLSLTSLDRTSSQFGKNHASQLLEKHLEDPLCANLPIPGMEALAYIHSCLNYFPFDCWNVV